MNRTVIGAMIVSAISAIIMMVFKTHLFSAKQ